MQFKDNVVVFGWRRESVEMPEIDQAAKKVESLLEK